LAPCASAKSSKTLVCDLTAENCPGEGQSCATFAPGECVQMMASRAESR
jgi:hypothetical protein